MCMFVSIEAFQSGPPSPTFKPSDIIERKEITASCSAPEGSMNRAQLFIITRHISIGWEFGQGEAGSYRNG